MRLKVESVERKMVLTIVRSTGVVTLIAEDKVGGIFRLYYQKSVVLPTKTLKALGGLARRADADKKNRPNPSSCSYLITTGWTRT